MFRGSAGNVRTLEPAFAPEFRRKKKPFKKKIDFLAGKNNTIAVYDA